MRLLCSHCKKILHLCTLVPTLKFEVLPDRYDTTYYAVRGACLGGQANRHGGMILACWLVLRLAFTSILRPGCGILL